MKALKGFLRPEFIGRVDEVVCFNPLTLEDYEKIAGLMLSELKEPLAEKGATLFRGTNKSKSLLQRRLSAEREERET